MKHISLFFLIVIFVVAFSLGGNKFLPKYKLPAQENPFLEFETAEAAAQYAEFDFYFPEEFSGFELASKKIRVLRAEKKINRLLEVLYFSDQSQENEIVRFRKSFGKKDISGDFQKYSVQEDADGGNFVVKLKGKSDGFYNATWYVVTEKDADGTEVAQAYSIMTQVPLTRQEMVGLARKITPTTTFDLQ